MDSILASSSKVSIRIPFMYCLKLPEAVIMRAMCLWVGFVTLIPHRVQPHDRNHGAVYNNRVRATIDGADRISSETEVHTSQNGR